MKKLWCCTPLLILLKIGPLWQSKFFSIYMSFKKIFFYLNNAKAMIRCDHTPLRIFIATNPLNSKVNNGGKEIAEMSRVGFKHIRRIADRIIRLKSLRLCDLFVSEEEGQECGNAIFFFWTLNTNRNEWCTTWSGQASWDRCPCSNQLQRNYKQNDDINLIYPDSS